jgi:hypothetical protein
MNPDEKELSGEKHEAPSRVQEFLDAVGKKTDNKVHHRILSACKKGDPATCVEEELKKVIVEILHET